MKGWFHERDAPGKPIARGRTADVFKWDERHILTLFHNWFSREDIEYKQRISRAVHASGVKTPAVGDLDQVEGRNGLVYERVEGMSMLEIFQCAPRCVLQLGRMLAELQVQMHACVLDADVPPLHKKLEFKIRRADSLPIPLKSTLTTLFLSIPKGNRVWHGDFHPANVLMNDGDATVIDWINASSGNPLADVARTSIVMLGATASSQIPNPLLKVFVRVFHSAYLRHYFRLRPAERTNTVAGLPLPRAQG